MYRVKINGIEIVCDTASEALALAKSAGAASNSIEKAIESSKEPQAPHAERSLRFLVAIRDAEQKGIGGTDLVKAVKCKGPSGLGTVVQQTRDFLRAAGVSLEGVASKERKGDAKLWSAGPAIDEGIRVLEKLARGS